jgi:hypothetical protein
MSASGSRRYGSLKVAAEYLQMNRLAVEVCRRRRNGTRRLHRHLVLSCVDCEKGKWCVQSNADPLTQMSRQVLRYSSVIDWRSDK